MPSYCGPVLSSFDRFWLSPCRSSSDGSIQLLQSIDDHWRDANALDIAFFSSSSLASKLDIVFCI
jgi:hypothetical protein